MMNINIICVGKLKEDYLKNACAEYIKRINASAKISVIELDESRLSEKPSDKEITNALQTEAKVFEKHIFSGKCFNIAMCIEGKMISSEELAAKFNDISLSGKSTVNFLIGSSFGLDEDLKRKCDFKLSVSKMTFPHQLFRVMLLEQIYRGLSINAGSKYHK